MHGRALASCSFGKSEISIFAAGEHQHQPIFQGKLHHAPRALVDGQSCVRLEVRVLHVLGWRLWATKCLQNIIRRPYTIWDVYRLDQLSMLRLYEIACEWECTREKQHLKLLVNRICRKVHGFTLSWHPVVRLPYGHQHLQPAVHKFLTLSAGEDGVHPAVRKYWLRTARIVVQQGRNVAQLLGNFRRVCANVDCSESVAAAAHDHARESNPLGLPVVDGFVSFRGDAPDLPAHIAQITSLHMKYIPVQTTQRNVHETLVNDLVDTRLKMKLLPGSKSCWATWLSMQPECAEGSGLACRYTAGYTAGEVIAVRRQLRNLVGVPIDKNRLLYFEEIEAYRMRLRQTFVMDTDHYAAVLDDERTILKRCKADYVRLGWPRFATFKSSGSLGFAQVLPKDKDCKLNRPIVPNCSHPMGQLFNMAARGLAFILQHCKLSHYNLFTTQQFVAQLAVSSQVVADQVHNGAVCDVLLSQSDIKDMYTNIEHSSIYDCVKLVLDRWLDQRRPHGSSSLCITKRGRRGVCFGRTKDRRVAVTMPARTIVNVVLYELKHAFFKVGTANILQQRIGVSMGSRSGPVLAWAVCMVSEHAFHMTLGADARFIHTTRYFDDVYQLILVPVDTPASGATEYARSVVDKHAQQCYPQSLRLIQNSFGYAAEMLACSTSVGPDRALHCMHRNKNAKYLMAGLRPRFACFVPFHSAHAGGLKLMRNTVLGMFHRMLQDTLPSDVQWLLPVLLCYHMELAHGGFPSGFMAKVFRAFLASPRIQDTRPWRALYRAYVHTVGQARWAFA